jgi:hypothetical protein
MRDSSWLAVNLRRVEVNLGWNQKGPAEAGPSEWMG